MGVKQPNKTKIGVYNCNPFRSLSNLYGKRVANQGSVIKMTNNKLTLPIFVAGLLLIGLVAAVGFSLVSAQTPSNNTPSNIVFGAGDNGKTVTVNDGSTISINLSENPSTGYAWNVSSTSGLTVTNDKYTQGASMPGASGTHEWTIKATGKGEQQFTAVYKRPWETGSDSTFVITINVI